MARKPALKRLASSAVTSVTAAGAAPLANGRQVHTVTFQPGRNASCEPVEVGPGYASEAFSVGRFKEECQDALQQLLAHVGAAGSLADADIDVECLRLPSLEEEIAAERGEIAAADAAAEAAAAAGVASAAADAGPAARDAAVAAAQAPGAAKPPGEEAARLAAAPPSTAAGGAATAGGVAAGAAAPLPPPSTAPTPPRRHTRRTAAAAGDDAAAASGRALQADGATANAIATDAAGAAQDEQQADIGGSQRRGAKRKRPAAPSEASQSPRRPTRSRRCADAAAPPPDAAAHALGDADGQRGDGQPVAAQLRDGRQPGGNAAVDESANLGAAAGQQEADVAEALSGHAAVKRRVRILQAEGGTWRSGTVASYNKRSGQHTVRFDETFFGKPGGRRVTERVTLADERVELLGEEPAAGQQLAPEQPAGGQPAGHPAAAAAVSALEAGQSAAAAEADESQPAAQEGPAAKDGDGAAGRRSLPASAVGSAAQAASEQGRALHKKESRKRLGVKDMGVKFHPAAELELIERVKQRRQQRMNAAVQALNCLQAEQRRAGGGAAGPKPKRDTNYAPPTAAAAAAATADDAADGDAVAAAQAVLNDAGGAAGGAAGEDTGSGSVAVDEVVLTVALSHPANAQRVLQQWRVLGRQALATLRDRLYCRSDLDLRANRLAVPSGMFYVEGCFYNDMRDAAAVDYSYPIRVFCHAHGLKPPRRPAAAAATAAAGAAGGTPAAGGAAGGAVSDSAAADGSAAAAAGGGAALAETAGAAAAAGNAGEAEAYCCADMERTTFEDLWLRIGAGAGYVYCHQGCCEHQLAFTDVRMLHPDDAQSAASYPELVFQKHSRKRRCQVCERAPAVKITYDDTHAPSNPAFWCLDCFNRMHYDEERRLISSAFKQFDYIHD